MIDRQEAPLELILSRDVGRVIPAGPVLRSGVRSGSLTRLRRGLYVDTARWSRLEREERYAALVRGIALSFSAPPVLSHQSAAVLWGLPLIGAMPEEVHVLVERASGGRSDPGIRRHALGIRPEDVTSVNGLLVTSLARTVVDLAASGSVYLAVAAADAAIKVDPYDPGVRLTKLELFAQWERMVPFGGFARAKKVIEFADGRSGSAGESASRVSIAIAGFPQPELQKHYVIDGRDVWGDFYWRHIDSLGEFDGEGKYLDARLRGGRTLEQVLLDEKYREDALRRRVRGFTRWRYSEALSPQRLRLKLLELGLEPARARLRGR